MKIFFDTEFTGLHNNTSLISIGLIDEKSNSFYAEFTDFDRNQVDKWIEENVVARLQFNESEPFYKTTQSNGNTHHIIKGDKKDIKEALRKWLEKYNEDIELVTDVGHFDMVLLIDIFGDAFQVPKNMVPTYYDINQMLAEHLNISLREAFDLKREEIVNEKEKEKHNSLWDAFIIKKIYEKIMSESKNA